MGILCGLERHNVVMKKNLRLGAALVAAGSLIAILAAQSAPQETKIPKAIEDSNKVFYNISRLNTVKFVLPLLLKKKQINDLLTSMEKVRATEGKMREAEAIALLKIDPEITAAVNAALEKGTYPNRELQQKILKTQDNIINIRRAFVEGNVEEIYSTCKKTLDEGQLKSMGAIDANSFSPGIKTDGWTDEDKQRFYVRTVLLDGLTYELLKKMYKTAQQ